jgi:hypothetical protein
MANGSESRPDYVGINWTAAPQGYRFLGSSPAEPLLEGQVPSGEWSRLLHAFHCAREGRFQQVMLLPELIRSSTDQHLRLAALRLLGDACPSDGCSAIVEFFTDRDESVRLAAYEAAACTGKLEVASELLQHGYNLRRGIERNLLADALTEILESDPERFVEPGDYAAYAASVLEKIERIRRDIVDDPSILFGSPMDIGVLVRRIMYYVEKEDRDLLTDMIEHLAFRFESMTGAPVSAWFGDDETLDLFRAEAALHDFQAGNRQHAFVVGRRYFFSHRVD